MFFVVVSIVCKVVVFSKMADMNHCKRSTRGRRLRQGKRAGKRRTRLKYVRLGMNNIRIIYWNVASIRQRGLILERLVFSADIIALQETRLREGSLSMTGFNVYYNRRHLGLAILVRDSIPVTEVDVSRWDSDDFQV